MLARLGWAGLGTMSPPQPATHFRNARLQRATGTKASRGPTPASRHAENRASMRSPETWITALLRGATFHGHHSNWRSETAVDQVWLGDTPNEATSCQEATPCASTAPATTRPHPNTFSSCGSGFLAMRKRSITGLTAFANTQMLRAFDSLRGAPPLLNCSDTSAPPCVAAPRARSSVDSITNPSRTHPSRNAVETKRAEAHRGIGHRVEAALTPSARSVSWLGCE